MAVPWWNECTSRNAPRWDWSYGLTGSSIEIQGGPLASVRAVMTTARIRVCMATSRYRLPVGCRPRGEGLGRRDPVRGPVPRKDVQLARGILTERQHIAEVDGDDPAGSAGHDPACHREAPHPAPAQIGIEVLTDECRGLSPAIHGATDDGAGTPGVRILEL